MENENMQEQYPQEMTPAMSSEMSPDEAMAALAISTRLSEQMMAQEAQMQQPMEETTPVDGEFGAELALEGTETPDTANITDEIDKGLKEAKTELKKELRDMIKSELKKLMDDEDDSEDDDEEDNKENNE